MERKACYLVVFIFIIFQTNVFAQDSLSIAGKTAIYGQLFGPEVLGIHFNVNTGKKTSLNFGIGVNVDVHAGMNYYFKKRQLSGSSAYAGFQVASIRDIIIFGSGDHSRQAGLYIPIGYEYNAKKGFSLQIDIGPNFVSEDWSQGNTYVINGSIKLGFLIKGKKES